jgi:hypothetical protein
MEKIEFVNLKSVGSFMELKTGNIYPAQTNNTVECMVDIWEPDLSMGILLDDASDEWYGSLSDYDFGTVKNLIDNR